MNASNAFGFVITGLVMELLPAVSPALVQSPSVYGESVRELWLMFMGAVLIAIGGGYLMRMAWARRPRLVWPTAVREAAREVMQAGAVERIPARVERDRRLAA